MDSLMGSSVAGPSRAAMPHTPTMALRWLTRRFYGPGMDDGSLFRSGGYFLTRPVTRDDAFMSTDLLPPTLVSLSNCLGKSAFEYWWNEEHAAEALEFGVPEDRLSDLVAWYRRRFERDLGAPNVAFAPSVIHEFLEQFVEDATGLVILGCGLSAEHRTLLLEHAGAPAGLGEYGVFEMLERNVPLEPGGRVLGYEPVSYEYGLEHSWICNALETEAQARIGVTPDRDTGLLASYREGVSVADLINSDDVGSEPGMWLPCLIVRYPTIGS